MTSSSRFALTLLALALAQPACALDDEPATDEATSALIGAGHWNAVTETSSETWRGAQVASANGLTYVVRTGSCGSYYACTTDHDTTQLRWAAYNASNVRVAGGDVPDQSANSKVSLAAFNGYLYMLHTGSDDSSATYLSRFNTDTRTWTQRKLDITSYGGPPSIAAFNGRLYLVGITSSSAMWYATMDSNENFTPTSTLPGYTSASRVSLTVGFGKLWIAHRAGSSSNIVYNTFDGTTWSGTTYLYGGVNGGALQGNEPVFAFDQNVIRLIHRRPGERYLWQTTYNGCQWATTETSLDTQTSDQEPSLAQGGPGLVLVTEHEDDDNIVGAYEYDVQLRTYSHPTLSGPPSCGVLDPG